MNRHAIAFEAPNVNNEKFPLLVLQHILGGHPHVSGGQGISRLSQLGSEAFSFQYSDTGLFGIFARAHSGASAAALVEKGVAELKKIASSLSDSEVATGKAKAKASLLFESEKRTPSVEYFSQQLLSFNSFSSNEFANVDKVTTSDVQKLAAKLLQSKPTIVSAEN